MREIKFRAWIPPQDATDGIGYMTSNPGLEVTSLASTVTADQEYIATKYMLNDVFSEPSFNQVFMQYTGLKDKNGTEIYEGDILSVDAKEVDKDYTVTVEWNQAENWGLGAWTYSPSTGWNDYELEVIGNIYETTELGRGKK